MLKLLLAALAFMFVCLGVFFVLYGLARLYQAVHGMRMVQIHTDDDDGWDDGDDEDPADWWKKPPPSNTPAKV